MDVQKKPVEVEARGPYHDTNTIERDFEVDEEYVEEHGRYYILRGVEGKIYPCGADIFHDTYEVLDHDRRVR